MTNRYLTSVAAVALIAGTGFAYAQGTGTGREAPSGGAAVQQSAPDRTSTTGQSNRDAAEPSGPSSGMKATQSDQKSPGGAKNQRAQDDMKAGTKGEKSAQDKVQDKSTQDKSAQDNMKGDKSKSMSSERNEKGAGTKDRDMKAEDRDRSGNTNAESKGAAEGRSQTTVGQAGAGARLSGEQRTRISGVFRDQRIEPLANANFAIVVGARVPRDITFHALPAEVVTIYPEWRGYEFVRVRDQILVINPRTLEIVAVLDA
ncbi:MAG TPA: DUF1236 domain-containing protein [Bradyrhizobium sp.]|nr:DUF1236 domain-containing protein [Bradyrhizobium sp.]